MTRSRFIAFNAKKVDSCACMDVDETPDSGDRDPNPAEVFEDISNSQDDWSSELDSDFASARYTCENSHFSRHCIMRY